MASQVFQAKRTALITGGVSGVGFAFAQLCQKFGMNVALVDKSTEGLEKAKDVLSGTAKNGQRTEVYDMVCYTRRPLHATTSLTSQLGRIRNHTMALPQVRGRSQVRQH